MTSLKFEWQNRYFGGVAVVFFLICISYLFISEGFTKTNLICSFTGLFSLLLLRCLLLKKTIFLTGVTIYASELEGRDASKNLEARLAYVWLIIIFLYSPSVVFVLKSLFQ